MRTTLTITDTDKVTGLQSNYVDFYIYCDLDGSVWKLVCFDHATKYKHIDENWDIVHKRIDFESDRVNIIIVKGNKKYPSYKTHYNRVVDEIESLKDLFRKDCNLKDILTKMGKRLKFEIYYY